MWHSLSIPLNQTVCRSQIQPKGGGGACLKICPAITQATINLDQIIDFTRSIINCERCVSRRQIELYRQSWTSSGGTFAHVKYP